MSYIDHRCRGCGHLMMWHRHHPGRPRCSACSCGCGDPGPVELVPTLTDWNKPTEHVTPPGDPWAYPNTPTCDCEDCQAFYDGMEAR